MTWQAPHQGIVQTPPRRGKTFALPLWWPANSEFAIGTSSTWKTSHCLAGRHSSSAAWFRCHDSIRAALPAFIWQVDSWLPLGVSPRRRSPGHEKKASDPMGRQPAQAYSRNPQAISGWSRQTPRSTDEQAGRANSVRIRNTSQIGAAKRVGKFFFRL
jgi:hypothetical protein